MENKNNKDLQCGVVFTEEIVSLIPHGTFSDVQYDIMVEGEILGTLEGIRRNDQLLFIKNIVEISYEKGYSKCMNDMMIKNNEQ